MDLFSAVRLDPAVARLVAAIRESESARTHSGEGLWGSAAYILAAHVWTQCNRPLLLVTAHGDEADDARDDFETAAAITPELLPMLESFGSESEADADLAAARLALCLKLTDRTWGASASDRCAIASHRPEADAPRSSAGGPVSDRPFFDSDPLVIVAPIQSLMQPVPTAAAIAATSLNVRVGQRLDENKTMEWIESAGFTRCDQVEVPGDFSRRGGIIDLFSPGLSRPVRIELFGDDVESIRFFDANTQRSADAMQAVRIPAFSTAHVKFGIGKGGRQTDQTTSFLALLPRDTIIAFHEPIEIQELGRTYWQRLGER
ncbi:MAG: hypothetical protein ACKVS9_00360, partial [Phycisphaerae bacterium]